MLLLLLLLMMMMCVCVSGARQVTRHQAASGEYTRSAVSRSPLQVVPGLPLVVLQGVVVLLVLVEHLVLVGHLKVLLGHL